MLKIRRPLGRLIFNMGIAIPGKTVFLIETAPWLSKRALWNNNAHAVNVNTNSRWMTAPLIRPQVYPYPLALRNFPQNGTIFRDRFDNTMNTCIRCYGMPNVDDTWFDCGQVRTERNLQSIWIHSACSLDSYGGYLNAIFIVRDCVINPWLGDCSYGLVSVFIHKI